MTPQHEIHSPQKGLKGREELTADWRINDSDMWKDIDPYVYGHPLLNKNGRAKVFKAHMGRFRYVLKCDIAQYFPSVDHDILIQQLARRIRDDGVLWLADTILQSHQSLPASPHYFPGDGLFEPYERRRGLPIGNQTSQFFANVYLDGMDHWVREVVKIPGYVRYVDDFLLFDQDKGRLHDALQVVGEYCAGLRLHLHPKKCA